METVNKELRAIRTITGAIEELPHEIQIRVLSYVVNAIQRPMAPTLINQTVDFGQ